MVLVGADHLGDVLYRTIGLNALRAALPRCEICFVASQPAAALLEGHPAIHSVLVAPRASEHRSWREWIAPLKRSEADVAFCYDSTGYWRSQLAVAMAGIPNCIGYVHKGFRGLATHELPIRHPQPFAAYFRDAVAEFAGNTEISLRPSIALRPEEHAAVAGRLSEWRIGQRPLVVASVTSRQPSHPAIAERMVATLAILREELAVDVILIGAKDEGEHLRTLAGKVGLEARVAAGCFSVREVVALFERAVVAFCLDSGPRHLANAAGIPVVFFRNLQFLRAEAGAYLPTEWDLAPPDVESLDYGRCGPEVPLFTVEEGVDALRARLTGASGPAPRP